MRHVSLTCKNHLNLRWSTKSIAVNSDGSYNGMRNIFFKGQISEPVKFYDAMSGVKASRIVNNELVEECTCSPADLTFAPEDIQLRDAHIAKYGVDKDESHK